MQRRTLIGTPMARMCGSPTWRPELIRREVDVIVTRGTPAALAAKRVTDTSGDPVATGIVDSWRIPGRM